MNYPSHWPKPNPKRTTALASRITEEQKRQLYHREITTRDLAKVLGVHEEYLSYMYPGKVPIIDKKPLIEARKLYKLEMAKLVIEGKHTTMEAAMIAHVSYNTMRRFIKKVQNVSI